MQCYDPNFLERHFLGIKYSEMFAQTNGEVDQIG